MRISTNVHIIKCVTHQGLQCSPQWTAATVALLFSAKRRGPGLLATHQSCVSISQRALPATNASENAESRRCHKIWVSHSQPELKQTHVGAVNMDSVRREITYQMLLLMDSISTWSVMCMPTTKHCRSSTGEPPFSSGSWKPGMPTIDTDNAPKQLQWLGKPCKLHQLPLQ